jgi:uncharacterized membrane protein YjdF
VIVVWICIGVSVIAIFSAIKAIEEKSYVFVVVISIIVAFVAVIVTFYVIDMAQRKDERSYATFFELVEQYEAVQTLIAKTTEESDPYNITVTKAVKEYNRTLEKQLDRVRGVASRQFVDLELPWDKLQFIEYEEENDNG